MLLSHSILASKPLDEGLSSRDSTVYTVHFLPSLGKSVLPASLFLSGVLYSDNIRNNNIIRDFRASAGSPSDYIQFSPAALMLALRACGVEGRSDWQRMLVTDAIAAGAMVAVTGGLKYTVRRERPDGSERTSFPSGHAARAFMTAAMLDKEYGETLSPWFTAAGYGAAAATGLMRIRDNNHWLSDVLAGAGIGIYSVELAYTLSDLLYGDSHITKPVLAERSGRDTHWRFSLATDYYLSTSFVDDGYGHEYVRPEYSAGVEASFFPWYLGVMMYGGFTRFKWTGSGDIIPSDGKPLPELKSLCAGIAGRVPVGRRLSIDGRFLVGKTMESRYSFTTGSGRETEFKLPQGKRILTGLGVSLRTSGSSELSLLAGTDSYEITWSSFTIGTRYNITF